jgi:hypothetical protein
MVPLPSIPTMIIFGAAQFLSLSIITVWIGGLTIAQNDLIICDITAV